MMILHISDLHFGTEQGAVVDALAGSAAIGWSQQRSTPCFA